MARNSILENIFRGRGLYEQKFGIVGLLYNIIFHIYSGTLQ